MASCHWRSSPGIKADTALGTAKLSPRLVECVVVTPGTSARLDNGKLGILELEGSGALTAMSASPPPGATPTFIGLLTLAAQPPPTKEKIPQLSGWPSYLKGRELFKFGAPSVG